MAPFELAPAATEPSAAIATMAIVSWLPVASGQPPCWAAAAASVPPLPLLLLPLVSLLLKLRLPACGREEDCQASGV